MTRRGPSRLLAGYLGRLRYPWLFGIALVLLLVDLAIPDFVPFLDEILLTVVTVLLGARKRRGGDAPGESGRRD